MGWLFVLKLFLVARGGIEPPTQRIFNFRGVFVTRLWFAGTRFCHCATICIDSFRSNLIQACWRIALPLCLPYRIYPTNIMVAQELAHHALRETLPIAASISAINGAMTILEAPTKGAIPTDMPLMKNA